jgi:Flp pilus assembly protein TadG
VTRTPSLRDPFRIARPAHRPGDADLSSSRAHRARFSLSHHASDTMPAHILRRLAADRGVAMVEMALVLPLLLVLLMGMLDFGRAINYWNDVNHIAGEGARFAAVNNNPGIDDPSPEPDFRKWVIMLA